MADCHDKPAHKRALASLVSLGLVQGLPPPNPRAIAEGDAQKMPRKARPIKAAKPPERRRQHRAARDIFDPAKRSETGRKFGAAALRIRKERDFWLNFCFL